MVIEVVTLVVAVVAAVASTAISMSAAEDQKDAARRKEGLEKERLGLQAQQRTLQIQREREQTNREARARAAALFNKAATTGAQFTSSTEGAVQAVDTGTRRENTYLDSALALGQQSDDVTRRQIELDTSSTISRATSDQWAAGVKGLGSLASAGSKSSGMFSGSTPTPEADWGHPNA